MTSEATSNPNLAIWISAIGFAGTLIAGVAVAIINSVTTLKGKKIDAQLKNDEQSYGFKMEILKHKLVAGEKEIGRLRLELKTCFALKEHYAIRLSPAYNADVHKKNTEWFHKVSGKANESRLDDSDSFLAYFSLTKYYVECHEALEICHKLQSQIALHEEKAHYFNDKLPGELDLEKQGKLVQGLSNSVNSIKSTIEEFNKAAEDARSKGTKAFKEIRIQMEYNGEQEITL